MSNETNKRPIDPAQEFIVVETFANQIVGTFDTEDEAVDYAKGVNKTAPGDSVYIVAKIVGKVALMKYHEINHKPGPAPKTATPVALPQVKTKNGPAPLPAPAPVVVQDEPAA